MPEIIEPPNAKIMRKHFEADFAGCASETIFGILIPFLAVIAVPFLVWGWGFHWTDLGLLLGMYVVTVLGITVGFHRLFVHRSFETYAWVKFIFAILGSMAVQGPLFTWVGTHRVHHQHSDTSEDPHSPQHEGHGLSPFCAAFGTRISVGSSCPIRRASIIMCRISMRAAACGWRIVCSFVGDSRPGYSGHPGRRDYNELDEACTGFIWGGLVRVFLVHHVTWSVNSACHLWGLQPYRSHDESRNNILFGILAMGEGWHNTHHAFPTSARHGLAWWQIDMSYWVIRTLAFLRLAWNLKLPPKKRK